MLAAAEHSFRAILDGTLKTSYGGRGVTTARPNALRRGHKASSAVRELSAPPNSVLTGAASFYS